MGYMSIIPAIVISIAVLGYILHKISIVKRPQWTIPFIPEQPMSSDLPIDGSKQRMGWVITLFAISLVGLSTEIIKLILLEWSSTLSLLIAWVSRGRPCVRVVTLTHGVGSRNLFDRNSPPEILPSFVTRFLY